MGVTPPPPLVKINLGIVVSNSWLSPFLKLGFSLHPLPHFQNLRACVYIDVLHGRDKRGNKLLFNLSFFYHTFSLIFFKCCTLTLYKHEK